MRDSAVIRLIGSDPVWYLPGTSDGPRPLDTDNDREALRQFVAQRRSPPVFAVPGSEVLLRVLPVKASERKHLQKSLPFLLEEELAEDVDGLHFSHCPISDETEAVAVTQRDLMHNWQQQLGGLPDPRYWVAEPLLLPRHVGEWVIVLEDGTALVRTGACSGFAVEKDLLPIYLDGALVEAGDTLPDGIIVYGQDQAVEQSLLPDGLRDRVQWRNGDFSTALLLADSPESVPNLLSGDFAPRLPLDDWWRQWRALAALLLLAFVLQLGSVYGDYRDFSAKNLDLRARIEQSFRQVFPSGRMQDAEIQVRRKLESLQGGASSPRFSSLIYLVGQAVASQPGTRLASINYNDRGGEMRLNLVAKDFEAVEAIRLAMGEAGLDAVMENSNAREGGVQARLRVRTRS